MSNIVCTLLAAPRMPFFLDITRQGGMRDIVAMQNLGLGLWFRLGFVEYFVCFLRRI